MFSEDINTLVVSTAQNEPQNKLEDVEVGVVKTLE
jgi:hypothetical protein